MGSINYLVLDVDGTLTDGKIYMGQDGEQFKAFDIKDGCGILLILPEYNITPVIITARNSKLVENRCHELNISQIHQGVKDKLSKLIEVTNGDLSSVAYVGDDIPDIQCMTEIKKAGGLVLCPADAIPEIKAIANYVSGYNAGDGSVRDCINYLVQRSKHIVESVESTVNRVVDSILSGNYADGKVEGFPYTIQEYLTKEETECIIESHRRHIDVQYVIEGHEQFRNYMMTGLTGTGKYDADMDVEYWNNGIIANSNILVPGSVIVVYSGQPHKGAIRVDSPENVKKMVCKIAVNDE